MYMRSHDPPYFCGGAKNNVAVNSNGASSDDETVFPVRKASTPV